MTPCLVPLPSLPSPFSPTMLFAFCPCLSQSHDSSANDQTKAVDAHRYDSKQENLPKNGDIRGRKVSQAVKRTKRCKDASGKSTSEVIDTSINDDLQMPRTRRQKV
ncbi:UNVERIFIED_CONTAM: hypothetical protein Sindi_1418600 [Sesamum indicum]